MSDPSTAIIIDRRDVFNGFVRFALHMDPQMDDILGSISYEELQDMSLSQIIDNSKDPAEMRAVIDNYLKHSTLIESAFTDSSVDSINNYESLEFLGDKVGSVVFIEYVEDLLKLDSLNQGVGTYLVARFLSNKPSSGYIQGHVMQNRQELWRLVSYIPDPESHTQKLHIAGDVFEAIIGLLYTINKPDTIVAKEALAFMYNDYGMDTQIEQYYKSEQYRDYTTLLKELLRDRLHIQYSFEISKGPEGTNSNVVSLIFNDSGFIMEQPGGAEAIANFLDSIGVITVDNEDDREIAEYLAAKYVYEWLEKNPVFNVYMEQSQERGREITNLYNVIASTVKSYNSQMEMIDRSKVITHYTRETRAIKKRRPVFVITAYLADGSYIVIENTSRKEASSEFQTKLKQLHDETINAIKKKRSGFVN